jgi:hypothetical protein
MSDREALITAALLGTERRTRSADPTGEDDPALALLDRAVRCAVARRAGHQLPTAPPPPRAPQDTRVLAAREAQRIMTGLLEASQVELINVWLATAAAYGVVLGPQHWPAIVRLAARNTDVDRADLAAALGAGGLWFVAQNPQWSRLEVALHQPPRRATPSAGPTPDAQAVREHPDTIFAAPQPWSRSLLEAVGSVLGSGRLAWGAVAYAQAVGARIPLEHYAVVRAAAHAATGHPPVGGRGRSIHDAVAALEATATVRAEMHTAFQVHSMPDPQEPR